MVENLEESLLDLKDNTVDISVAEVYRDAVSVQLSFRNGAKLRADYWRFAKEGKASLSSFDDRQQYGLPEPIDAVKEVQMQLVGKVVTDVCLDRETGDLLLQFAGNLKLQIFKFTGYEDWEISFPNGTTEYSNHVKLGRPL
jgi:hypothetical protein